MSEPSLTFGYTPDPDDAFHYYALEQGIVRVAGGGGRPRFLREHVQRLNELALERQLDVTAISSAFYPRIDRDYVLLSAGASVGRGYGPALAARRGYQLGSLVGKRVAVPGLDTTGCLLARLFHGDFDAVPLPFDQVAAAVADGTVEAGVLIHEELLRCGEHGLVKVECLGERWQRETGLPLPVGLVAARRDLGAARLRAIRDALRGAIEYALGHRDEAGAFAARFGLGTAPAVREEFIQKFANQDTICLPDDVRRGLAKLYREAYRQGWIDHQPAAEIV